MGQRKLITKREIKFIKSHPEMISFILGLSFIILGLFDLGLYSGLLYLVMGVLLIIITGLVIFNRIYEKYLYEKKKKRAILRKRLNNIENIDPWQFEKLVADSLNNVGFSAYSTSGSGDKGIDVVANKGSYKIVIQVKKYQNSVGFDAIKEAHIGRDIYNAKEAWVVTSSNKYTKQAIETANQLNIRLFTWGDFAIFLEKESKEFKKRDNQ